MTVRTRPGRNITAEVPELEGLVDALEGREVVLDGERVAGAGRPWDFYKTRPSWKRRPSLTFVAFDVLCSMVRLSRHARTGNGGRFSTTWPRGAVVVHRESASSPRGVREMTESGDN